MEDWITIKNLKTKQPGKSNRAIARELGISHNTVKAALGKDGVPEYRRSGSSQCELESFHDILIEMLTVKKFKGSRIFNELKSKGYKGGKTSLYLYLSKIRPTEQKYFTPYETGPGEQAQFDWSPYTVTIGGDLTMIYIYSYINSFSRFQILEASLSQNQGAILEALENSIVESGGVCQRLQTDNAKAFVINASKNNFKWNPRYLNFCAHYGFMPTRSLPGHPWSKGKVEKPFSYLETHFIAGSSFEDFFDLQRKLKIFQEENSRRIHSVTKAAAIDLFGQEKLSLLSLPETRYVGIKEDNRKASYDCLLSYNGSRYSVPWMFAGKWVWIKISKGYFLQIYSQANKLIASHTLSMKKGSVVINPEHYKSNKSYAGSFEVLKSRFLENFPDQGMFLEKLKAQKRMNVTSQLHQILSLSKLYTKDDFLEAISKCMEYNVFNHSFISGYLEKNHKQSFKIEPVEIKTELPKENVKRDMSQYNMF
jgi:transposase